MLCMVIRGKNKDAFGNLDPESWNCLKSPGVQVGWIKSGNFSERGREERGKKGLGVTNQTDDQAVGPGAGL